MTIGVAKALRLHVGQKTGYQISLFSPCFFSIHWGLKERRLLRKKVISKRREEYRRPSHGLAETKPTNHPSRPRKRIRSHSFVVTVRAACCEISSQSVVDCPLTIREEGNSVSLVCQNLGPGSRAVMVNSFLTVRPCMENNHPPLFSSGARYTWVPVALYKRLVTL